MSKIVDERVVEMRFDNKNFEKNVKQSMSTLDKLKAALKMDGASRGLEEVERRANSLRFASLSNAVETLADKFTGLEMIGTMAMIRIAQSAANAGINLVKSLSVDNIVSGWQKLQQKANSMSTLISQGYKTEVVEEQLEKLNWFSDETSYNFTDMIDNIAKFTATGKGLEDSVTAMQGIALWAAKSGQNAQKASAAMYQLSQALGAGYMRKEDWKSIQNASMDTAEFRKQTLETAVAMGKVKKIGEDTYQSLLGNKMTFTQQQFAESLTEGQWFTSDVMMEVYKKYAKASDQMKKAIDIMADDHEITLTAGQMIKAYDALKNNTFDDFLKEEEINDEKAIAALKNMVSEFDEFGISTFRAGQEYRTFNDTIDATKDAVSTKWMNIMETLIGNVDAQKALWTAIGEKFYDWFAAPLDDLQELLNRWVDMGGRDSLHQSLKNIGAAIGAIVKPIKEAWGEIFPPMTAKRLTELTDKFKEFTSHLKISEKTADSIKSVFRALFSVAKTGITIFTTLASALFKLISVFRPLGELLLTGVGFLSKWVDKTAEAARNSKWLSDTLNGAVSGIKKFAEAIGSVVKKLLSFESVVNFFKGLFTLVKNLGLAIGKFIGGIIHNGDLNQFIKIINSGLLGALIYKTTSWISSLKKLTDGFKDTIISTLKQLKDVLGAYEKDINAKALLKVAVAVGILAGSIWVLSGIDGVALTKAIGAMTMLVAELLVAFKVLTKLGKDQKILLRNSIALISLSTSLLILSSAINKIASLSFGEMITGLIGLAGAMGVLVAAIKLLPDDGKTKKKTKGLITLSLSLLIMSVALKKIGSMDVLSIVKGLSTMLIYMLIVTKTLSKMNAEGAIRKSISLLILANSMIILAGALKILGSMTWTEILKGLTAMGIALGELVIAMNFLPKKGNLLKATGLLISVTSMIILAGALKILATMSWSDIKNSLKAMGGALLELVLAMKIMGSNIGGALAGAGALLIASAALIELAIGLKILASIKPDKMVKALLGLAAALTILGIAGALLSKVAGGLLMVAGAAALFGVAAVALGVGLGLIAAGISALALALSAGTTAIVAGLSSIILGIVGLIPEIVKTLGLAVAEFCKVIIECAPLIAKALGTVLLEAVKMLKDFVPPIVTSILDLFIQTIRAITGRVPELIVSIAELLNAIFKGFMEAMGILDSETLIGGIKAIGLISAVFILLAGLAVTAPLAMVGVIAFAALLTELALVLQLMSGFKSQVAALESAGEVLQAIGGAIGKFIGGIIGGFGLAVSATMPEIATNLSDFMTNLQPFLNDVNRIKPDIAIRMASLSAGIMALTAANFISSISRFSTIGHNLPVMGAELSAFMTNAKPFIDGAILITPNMMKGVQSLASAVMILTGANLLKNLTNGFAFFTGGNSFANFGKEIAILGTGMRKFADNLGTFSDEQVDSITAACAAISALAKAAKQIPNEGGLWAGIVGDNSIGKWSAYLPPLGTNLSEFVKNLGSFSSSQMDAVSSAGKAIAELAKAAKQIPNEGGLWSKIVGDNGIGQFSNQLPLTGKCLSEMAKSLQGFTAESVEVITNAGEAISALAIAASKIPNSGGLVSLFTGDNDISVFAFKLPLVATFLKKFVTNLGSFDKKAVERSQFAGESIAALANAASKIPNSGGLVTLFTGDNDISKFANKFPGVGTNLREFVDNLGEFSEGQVITTDCAGRAISALATAASNIPSVGPLAKLFSGESDISKFAGKFPSVATSLRGFVDNLGEFSEGQVVTADCAGRAIKALGEAAHNIPAEDGLWQKLAGKQSLAEFADDLPNVGTALSNFVKNLSSNGDFTTTQVATIDAACNALKTLASVSSAFPKTGGVWQWLSGENDISKHASKFPAVAEGLKGFTDKLKDYDESKVASVNAATEALKALSTVDDIDFGDLADSSEDAKTVGVNMSNFISKIAETGKDKTELAKDNADAFVELVTKFSSVNGDNIKKIGEGLKNIGETGIDSFVDSLSGSSPKDKVSQAMRDLIIKILDTMEGKRSELEDKMISIVNSMINKVDTHENYEKMTSLGKNFAQGFANGIENNRYLAVDAGTHLGNDAYNAAKRAIDAHSPSKKAHKLGNFFGMGFINGIHEYTSDAYGESYTMADQARKGLTSAISKVNDILNDGTTNQPVIRPVLDLSDIESGAGRINGMFNSVDIGNNLNAISVGMKQKGQNGTANDVVSAINKLGSNLGSTGDTYNINGITYGDDSNLQDAIRTLIRAANIERRS